jgi:DNA primase
MDATEEIKARLSIEDVVGRYVELKRAGASLKGLCPFHQEKTPSFVVSPSRGTFHCFGCQRGGDVFTFLMEIERLQFPEALKRLAEQAGVELPDRRAAHPSLKAQLYDANASAAEVFTELLLASPGERARSYLKTRGFGREAVDLFGLGFAPASRDLLITRLHNRGFDDRILLAAGLAIQDDVGGAPRDRFRSRLIFPIRDAGGRISGFGGRALDEDRQPKYLNSPQTEVFDKSAVLFGIQLASDPIQKQKKAVLVEGYLDAVRAHLAGYRNTVASLGTAVTTQQLESLGRQAHSVVLALDPDPAGRAAAARTALTALAEVTRARGRQPGDIGALDLLVASLPDSRDPDELIQAEPELWEAAIADAIPTFDFYFEQTMQSLDRTSDSWRQEAIDRLVPLVQQFATSAGWQAVWMERISRETGVDVQALVRAMPANRQPLRRQTRPTAPVQDKQVAEATTSRALTSDPERRVEESLLALLLRAVVIPSAAAEPLRDVALERQDHRILLTAVLSWQPTANYDYEMLRETFPEDVRVVADELHARDVPVPEDAKLSVAVSLHLARLKLFRTLAQIDRVKTMAADLPPKDAMIPYANLADLYGERLRLAHELEQLSRLVHRSARSEMDQGTIVQDSGRL